MLFFGKENVFMCLVAFQKMFRKIFSDVWLCSWKYHRKNIFFLLLTFSQLPNKYIISFISQNTNKTQKKKNHQIRSNWEKKEQRETTGFDEGLRSARRFARSRPTLREIAIDARKIAIGAVLHKIAIDSAIFLPLHVYESFFLSLFLPLHVCELLSLRVSVPKAIWR